MKYSCATKSLLATAVFGLLMPTLVIAQDVVNSPYVASGATGSVHIYPTPAYSQQVEAQRGPVAPGVLSYNCGRL